MPLDDYDMLWANIVHLRTKALKQKRALKQIESTLERDRARLLSTESKTKYCNLLRLNDENEQKIKRLRRQVLHYAEAAGRKGDFTTAPKI